MGLVSFRNGSTVDHRFLSAIFVGTSNAVIVQLIPESGATYFLIHANDDEDAKAICDEAVCQWQRFIAAEAPPPIRSQEILGGWALCMTD